MSKKTPIFFRLVQKVEDDNCFGLQGGLVEFDYDDPAVNVSLRADSENNTAIIFESKMTKKANPKVKEDLDFLFKEKYLDPATIESFKGRMRAEGRTSYCTPIDMLSPGCLDFAKSAYETLSSFSTRTFRAIRWRKNIKGDNEFFEGGRLYWSFEGSDWREFSFGLNARFRIAHPLSVSSALKEFAFNVVNGGKSEPLAYELLREAESLCYQRHSRSALLVGIAAVETGVKQCISTLKPDTQWLIENMPSPSIVQILRDYLSKIPVSFGQEISSPFPQSTILDPLRDLVQMRNVVAHGGIAEVSAERLSTMVRIASDILRIVDVYMGNLWALEYVSDETRQAMGFKL